jgi:hypothetical protein
LFSWTVEKRCGCATAVQQSGGSEAVFCVEVKAGGVEAGEAKLGAAARRRRMNRSSRSA